MSRVAVDDDAIGYGYSRRETQNSGSVKYGEVTGTQLAVVRVFTIDLIFGTSVASTATRLCAYVCMELKPSRIGGGEGRRDI